MIIKQPHGYLKDADGNVVIRFANWETGEHDVPDVVETVECVNGPTAHTKDVADKYRDR